MTDPIETTSWSLCECCFRSKAHEHHLSMRSNDLNDFRGTFNITFFFRPSTMGIPWFWWGLCLKSWFGGEKGVLCVCSCCPKVILFHIPMTFPCFLIIPMFPFYSYGHFMVHLNHSPQDIKLWNLVWLPIILGMLPVLSYRNRHMHVIEQNG
jgi:hypothetical protein